MNQPSRLICDIPVKQQFVCNHWINSPLGFKKFKKADIDQSLASRFEEQAKNHPDSIAIKSSIETFTYKQLNATANRLAKAMLSQRGTSQEVVAILLEKGATYIAAMLGALKTGKIFLPLDPSFPITRLNQILEDSQAVLIVTKNQNLTLANELAKDGCQLLNIDDIETNISWDNPAIEVSPDAPAYLIYTSGSTGKPKGVIHSHRNTLHYCMNDTNTLLISPEDRVIFLYSCSTLGGMLCIFYTLLNGASLYSFNVKEQGLTNLASWLIEEEITIYHSFATLFRHFIDTLTGVEQFPKIRLVKLGGEATLKRDVELYKRYFSSRCILYASLGATETGTFRNFIVDKDTRIETSTVPIGYSVQDMEVVLLDETGAEVGFGDIGEIAVKSEYLALGYWQKPELTKSVFLSDSSLGQRIYRTGDLGRIEPDGCLVHMGRKDFQVKIRGYRIEVAEIEMALLNISTLKEAVVIAREDIPEHKRLVAYVVTQEESVLTSKELRTYLQDKLPDYMIPSHFVFLNALPLTPNGKVDRLALPAPNLATIEMQANFVAPQNTIEQQLIHIWEATLGIKPIGVKDNFFELGGNSLLAVTLFSAIEQKFGKKLPLSSLLLSGTVEALAQILGSEQVASSETVAGTQQQDKSIINWSSLVEIQPKGSKPAFFCIHSLGGEVLSYRNLALHLGTEQPVYGLQPIGLDGKQRPYTQVEDMAAHYIQEIQKIQPQGPYFLGGYSFGGIVALEIAQQLQKQGEKIGILVMLDTCRPGYRQRLSFLKRIPLHLNNLVHQGSDYFWHKAKGWVKHYLYYQCKHLLNVAPHLLHIAANLPKNDAHLDIMAANTQALSNYTFQPYLGKITLLRTEDQNRYDAVGVKYNQDFGWGEIANGGVDIYYIPGSHVSLLNEPYVKVVSEKLNMCLDNADDLA